MKARFLLLLVSVAFFLGGCVSAPQLPVSVDQTKLNGQGGKLGVVMSAMPKVDTFFPGANCLLCIAAASVANSSLTDYTRTLPLEDLSKLKNDVATLIRKKGVDVIVIDEDIKVDALDSYSKEGPNVAKKNFTALQKKYSVDKLLVIDIRSVGMLRPYASYFPTSEPKGILQGTGYIVNLSNNTYEWYMPVDIAKSTDAGKWDEPPKFPGLTNAYYQALELGKDSFLGPFKN